MTSPDLLEARIERLERIIDASPDTSPEVARIAGTYLKITAAQLRTVLTQPNGEAMIANALRTLAGSALRQKIKPRK